MSLTATSTERRAIKFPDLVIPGRPHSALAVMATATQVVDTSGWDTVYAVPVATLNAAIAKKKSSPTAFDLIDPSSSNKVTGTFGDWSITANGSGALVAMTAPIKTGSATISGTTYVLDNASVHFTIQLEFIPEPPVSANAAKANGVKHELRVKSVMATATGPVVEINNVVYQTPLSFGPQAIIKALLQEWFNNNLQQFNQVFSAVTLNAVADTGAFQWLKPTSVGYAATKTSDGTGIFGVLAMTGGRSSAGLSHSLSALAIPTGAPSGFLISAERFLADVMLPALPHAFENTKISDFELTTNTVIRNKSAILISFQANGKTYTGEVEVGGFVLSIVGEKLHLDIPKMQVNYSDGIDIFLDLHEEMHVTVKPRSDGTNALWFEQTEEDKNATRVDHTVELAAWVRGIEIGLDIVAAIIGAVIGAFGGAAKVAQITGFSRIASKIIAAVIGTVIGLVAGIIFHTADWIALANEQNFDKLPALEKLIVEGLITVEWPNSSGYALLSAGLNKSLQLGIDPKFITA